MKHRWFVPMLGVVLLAMLGAEARGQNYNPTVYWCTANFPPAQQAQCVWQAAQGAGPYFICGPGGTNAGLCGGVCCAAGQVCAANACATPTPTARTPTKTAK